MNRAPLQPITEEQIRAYERDGVVCLRGQIDAEWIERMLAACRAHNDDPSPHFREYWGDTPTVPAAAYSFMAHRMPDFRDFMRESPLAEIAATFMRSDSVRFWYDQMFVKEPAAEADLGNSRDIRRGRIFWHNDLPFWPLRGEDIISIWVPFTPVGSDDGPVEYIAGSHRQGKLYRPHMLPRGTPEMDALEPCPDFDLQREDPGLRFLSWEMEPGDCLVHHPLTIHGSAANRASTERIALSVRYMGKDVRYEPIAFPYPWFTDQPKVAPGAYPNDEKHFPLVWTRPPAGPFA